MPGIARQGDSVATGHLCDTTTSLAAPGQSTVYVNGILACRLGDSTVTHDILVGAVCVPHTATIGGSSSTVYVAGSLVARIGDGCDAGSITVGSSNVFAG